MFAPIVTHILKFPTDKVFSLSLVVWISRVITWWGKARWRAGRLETSRRDPPENLPPAAALALAPSPQGLALRSGNF